MKSVLIVKNKDQVIPKEHLQKVLHEFAPVSLGAAATNQTDDGKILLVEHWPALADLGDMSAINDAICTMQEELKGSTMLFSFTDGPGLVVKDGEALDTPDMQPFPLLTDDAGNVYLVAALNGDFTEFASEDKADMGNAAREDLLPRIMQAFTSKDVDQDLEKLMAYIRGNTLLQKDLKKLCKGESGIITLFSSENGEMLSFPKKDGDIYSAAWGWSSHPIKAEEKKQPVVEKKSSILGKFASASKSAPTTGTVATPATDTAATVVKKKVQCPKHISNKANIREWYLANAGYVPEGYKNRPEVEVNLPIKDFKDLKTAMIENGSATPVTESVTDKDTAPKHIVPITQNKSITGVMSAEQKEKFKNDQLILKTLDSSSQVIPSLEALKEVETKKPSFMEQTGITIETMLHWDDATKLHFLKEYDFDTLLSAFNTLLCHTSKYAELKDKKEEAPAAPKLGAGLKFGKKNAA